MSEVTKHGKNDFVGSNREAVAIAAISTGKFASQTTFKGGIRTIHSAKGGVSGATVETIKIFAAHGVEGTLPLKKSYIYA